MLMWMWILLLDQAMTFEFLSTLEKIFWSMTHTGPPSIQSGHAICLRAKVGIAAPRIIQQLGVRTAAF